MGDASRQAAQFVAFSVAGQDYCVDIMLVREIRAWDGASDLPDAPDHVRGVINLRGQIVPVIDLKTRFELGRTETARGAVIVVVTIGENLYGLLVESVSDILTAGPDDIAPSPDISTKGESDGLLTGIVKLGDAMIAVLDPVRLIA